MRGAALLDNGENLRVKGKQLVPEGRTLRLCLPGGGGMGDPLQRDLEDVAADLRAGIVSRGAAHRDYGAVVDESGAIDVEASRRLRAERVRAATGSEAVKEYQDA